MSSDFLQQMTTAGLAPAKVIKIVNDGQIHRYQVEGDRAGSLNGWYICFGDCMVAGSWRTGYQQTFFTDDFRKLSPVEQHRIKLERERAVEQARKAREADAKKVAVKLLSCWDNALPATDEHPYLQRKRIPAHGLRRHGNRLLIPLRDIHEKLWSLQYIDPDGNKRFAAGGRIRGCMHLIGKIENVVIIAEGYATAASLHAMTGYPVVTAFNAGNLKVVAMALREKYPKAKIIVAADNDRFSKVNTGILKANEAAQAVGGKVICPKFAADEPGTDYSDIYIRMCNDES